MQRNGITLANWQDPAHTLWSYRHMRELVPTARVCRSEHPSSLRSAPGGVREPPPAARLLDDDHTDALIILDDGEVLLEEYRRDMRADDVHLLQSISKSITGVLAGILAAKGVLHPDDPVTTHIPELGGTSFDGASVRHLLDMRAGTRFDETYANPASDLRASEAQFGWAPGPRPAPTSLAYLSQLPNHREHGGRFEYRSILTDVLGLVIERAAGRPFADTLGRELWSPMGAETDGYVTVDADGFPVADGGICVTLRDLARFGHMVLDGGMVDGRQVVASDWLADTLAGGDDSAEAFAQDGARRRAPRRPLPQSVVGPRRRPGVPRHGHPRPVPVRRPARPPGDRAPLHLAHLSGPSPSEHRDGCVPGDGVKRRNVSATSVMIP